MINTSITPLILRAYPGDRAAQPPGAFGAPRPPRVLGLPSWAESERYDVNVKGAAGLTREQQQQMWRALLADRMKLAAHYEMREEPSYDLVPARGDRRLGAQLRPSTLDCSTRPAPAAPPVLPTLPLPGAAPAGGGGTPGTRPPLPFTPPTPQEAMSRCGFMTSGNELYSGGMTMTQLAGIISDPSGRIVLDRTGLEGFYSVRLTFSRRPPDAAPTIDDAPSVFTALAEQLGLKLESSRTQVQVLVVDHIERPTED
jgi:uncharacterized protein (TIGR03435 family)